MATSVNCWGLERDKQKPFVIYNAFMKGVDWGDQIMGSTPNLMVV